MLENGIQIRDAKSRFLRAALLLFVVGFSLYCFAIAQLLIAARGPSDGAAADAARVSRDLVARRSRDRSRRDPVYVARHPSETQDHVVLRVLAWCLLHEDGPRVRPRPVDARRRRFVDARRHRAA